jgi:hypothetical protein
VQKQNQEHVINHIYVNGITFKDLKKKLNMRQTFELFYTIICCYASFGYCIVDINLENFMTKKDSFNTVINVYGKMFYFESKNSVCIIDYQTDNVAENTVNLKKYIYAVAKLLNDDVKDELLKIESGNYNYVMKQFINCNCFKPYIIYNKNKCDKYRNIVFNIIKTPSVKKLKSKSKRLTTKSKGLSVKSKKLTTKSKGLSVKSRTTKTQKLTTKSKGLSAKTRKTKKLSAKTKPRTRNKSHKRNLLSIIKE